MNVQIKTIPHKKQRYETVGDWQFDKKDNLVIKVSKLGDRRFEMLVAFHEFIEVLLCDERGITDKEVTEFDVAFEMHRQKDDNCEPGDDPRAPYFNEHQFATSLEKAFAKELGVNWEEYENAIYKL